MSNNIDLKGKAYHHIVIIADQNTYSAGGSIVQSC